MKLRFLDLVNTLQLIAPFTLASVIGIAGNTSAQALQFQFTHDSDTPDYVIDGFNEAGKNWASNLQDDVTVNIRVHFEQPSNPDALGGAFPNMMQINYDDFLTNSFRDISSQDDLTAFKNLQIDSGNQGLIKLLQGLGVDIKNKESANVKILQDKGFDLQDNKTIVEQAKDIFKQMTLEQLNTLNRNQIQFFDSRFSMLMNNDKDIIYKDEKLKSVDDKTLLDNNKSLNNKTIWLTHANAKALGLILDKDNTEFDAEIYINNDDIWDYSRVYNRNAEVDSNKFDLLSVAKHEIGHALGFVSGVDMLKVLKNTIKPAEVDSNKFDLLSFVSGVDILDMIVDAIKALVTPEGNTTQTNKEQEEDKSSDSVLAEDDLAYTSPMDLFRCSVNSKNKGVFDWSLDSETYFSIDGCKTNLGKFANGDRNQVSHWYENSESPIGIMNPTLGLGQSLNISDLDLKLLNVIGWDVGSTSISDIDSQIKKTKTIIVESSNNQNASNQTALAHNIERLNKMHSYNSNFYGFWQEKDYTKSASVPEPSIIGGLGIFGLFSCLFRRR